MMDASLREGVRDIRQFQHPQLWFHFWLTPVNLFIDEFRHLLVKVAVPAVGRFDFPSQIKPTSDIISLTLIARLLAMEELS